MGCNQSSDNNQWAYANEKPPPIQTNGKPTALVAPQQQEPQDQTEVDAATIEEYLELEKKIAGAETNSPTLILQQKKEQLAQLEDRIKIQDKKTKALQEQTELIRENADLVGSDIDDKAEDEDVRKKLLELDEDKQDEKREALAVFNNKEIAKKELSNLEEQKASLENEIETLAEESTSLHSLYSRQDELLKRIFGGDYGSPEENKLEETLDQHEELRNRIVEANFKWKQSQLMVDYAFKQLNEAVKRWESLPKVDESNLEERYSVASIARNNLVASAQNIQGAQRYLSNVEFPYCAPPEVATLNKATAYIFTDMQSTERHAHALSCYSTTAKRCGALLQWITQVVNNTIAKDLEDINKKVSEASRSLRQERVRLIKVRAKEITGRDVDITVADIDTDVNVQVNLNDLHRTDGIDPSLLATLSPAELAALSSISADDLAPPPSNEDIFGKVDALKSQFEEDNQKITKQFEENQARVENSLQAKLAARRRRRARVAVEEKELEALTEAKENGDDRKDKIDKKHRDKEKKKHKKHKDKDTEDTKEIIQEEVVEDLENK